MSSHIPTSIQDDPLWVTVFWCYNCGKHGHGLTKCNQCSQAYYCDAECQQKHWQTHKGACKAAVAALARHEYRERLARAIRESRHLSLDGAHTHPGRGIPGLYTPKTDICPCPVAARRGGSRVSPG